MWIATRPFRYRGVGYAKGDAVPAEGWPSRRAFIARRVIRFVADAEPQPVVTVETEGAIEQVADQEPPTGEAGTDVPSLDWTRADLNAYAVTIGIGDPESLPNKWSVLDAIEDRLTAPTGEN
ncbi:MAG: hypothetical protein ACRDGM_07855 [bacterium]